MLQNFQISIECFIDQINRFPEEITVDKSNKTQFLIFYPYCLTSSWSHKRNSNTATTLTGTEKLRATLYTPGTICEAVQARSKTKKVPTGMFDQCLLSQR